MVVVISYVSKFYTLIVSKIYRFSVFSFPKNYSIRIKGQSEHSGLGPDIRGVLLQVNSHICLHSFVQKMFPFLCKQHKFFAAYVCQTSICDINFVFIKVCRIFFHEKFVVFLSCPLMASVFVAKYFCASGKFYKEVPQKRSLGLVVLFLVHGLLRNWYLFARNAP